MNKSRSAGDKGLERKEVRREGRKQVRKVKPLGNK